MILGFPRAKQGFCHTKHGVAGGIILWALLTVFLVFLLLSQVFLYIDMNVILISIHQVVHKSFTFSSSDPKPRMSFSDEHLSVVCPRCCCRCIIFFTILSSSLYANGQISTQLGTKHPPVKGIQRTKEML